MSKKKLNVPNVLRILAWLMFTFYLTFNGVHINIAGLKLYVNGVKDYYNSGK
jgi:hypothetical protein